MRAIEIQIFIAAFAAIDALLFGRRRMQNHS